MQASTTRGSLFLVSTPIGNLEDITLRALRVLKEVDLVAAEDTRRTGLLLRHYGISNRLDSYHDHNKARRTPVLLNRLRNGAHIAVVSDAGTPGISDPAYYLVRRAVESEIPVIPIPGATAAIAALTVSGLPTDRFVFEGFLPVRKGRKKRLEKLKEETRTIILYESPHRLQRTLNDLHVFLGNRTLSVCRELTKKFEECIRTTAEEAMAHFLEHPAKGEFVLIVSGRPKSRHEDKNR